MEKEILKLDDFGRGITYVDNIVTFVKNTIPKDIIDLKITKSHKRYNEGIPTKIIKPSPLRIEPFCPYFSKCGGCTLQNLSYEETLKYKKEKVINYFAKSRIEINPITIPNDTKTFYRNKISLKVENFKIGFYEEQTHNIISIDACMITNKIINKTIPLIKTFNIINGNVTIRCNSKDDVLIIINTKDKLTINKSLLNDKINIVLNNKKIYSFLKKYDIMLCVPMRRKKQKTRGYNQSELIAKEIAKELEICYLRDCLIKIKDTKKQSTLTRNERKINLNNAFGIKNKEKIQNKNVILFDDIFTTGSTMKECSKILKDAGVKKIAVLTLATD